MHAGQPERAQAYVDEVINLRIADISPRLAALTVAVHAMTASDDDVGDLYERALAAPGLSDHASERNRIRLSYGM